MAARCSNELGGPQHRHVHLVQGRAKAAQVYPREFGERVCDGIAAQKRLDSLGLRAHPTMDIDSMHKASGSRDAADMSERGIA